MKKISLLALAIMSLVACKKDHEGAYKVRYTLTGTIVEQFKVNYNTTEHFVETPFTGTRDTTLYVQAGTTISLDAKAGSSEDLIGSIYVNDGLVATQTDGDADADGKTAIKVEYTIPVK